MTSLPTLAVYFEYFHLPLGILLTSLPCYRRYLNTAPLKCDQSLWPNNESCFRELKKRISSYTRFFFVKGGVIPHKK